MAAPSGLENVAAAPSAPVVVADVGEPRDAMSGAFGGVAFASVLISVVTLVIGLTFYYGTVPPWVKMITDGGTMYTLLFGVALLVVTGILALVGMVAGKAG